MQRRPLLMLAAVSAAVPALVAPRAAAQTAAPAAWPKAAFEATTVADALARLGIAKPGKGDAILLDAPSIAAVAQPIAVTIETALPKVEQIALLADRLPTPLLALVSPPPQGATRVRLTIHLPRTSALRACVRSNGQWLMVEREVKLAAEPA